MQDRAQDGAQVRRASSHRALGWVLSAAVDPAGTHTGLHQKPCTFSFLLQCPGSSEMDRGGTKNTVLYVRQLKLEQ